MRDGVRLATEVYQPETSQPPWPTILIRTPYARHTAMDDIIAGLLTDVFQYALVIQSTRGRFGSEGVDSLFLSDGWGRTRDGYDAVEWIARQSWSDGKVGTWGASGYGITQYLAAGAAPPHLTCCLVIVAASNLYEDAIFYGGAYRKSLVDNWVTEQGSTYLLDFFVQHPDYEPRYDVVNLATRYDSVNVPIVHVAGWHDIFLQGQINAFCGIQEYGGPQAAGNQKLVIGPWVHDITASTCGELTFPNSSALDFFDLMFDWFDHWLKGVQNDVPQLPAIQYYLMGDADQPENIIPGNTWESREDWPPPATLTPFYFRQDGCLSTHPPDASEPPDAFDFDPDDPVPTVGGRNLFLQAGSADQRPVESRPDVLVYTTDPLSDPLTVVGRVTVTLWASSDAKDTDFTAKLCDVYPDGRSMLVADGIVQARHRNALTSQEFLTPGFIYAFPIDLWSTAIVFAPGHSIRLSISSSNAPRFETNPNTGEPFRQNTTTRVARQTVYHSAAFPSALYLPVTEGTGTEEPVAPATASEPRVPTLNPNFPNPFNDETSISLRFPNAETADWHGENARIEIVDLRGRCVKTWGIDPQPGDRITIPWHGDDQSGRRLPSGVYFCRLTAGGIIQTRKITLLR